MIYSIITILIFLATGVGCCFVVNKRQRASVDNSQLIIKQQALLADLSDTLLAMAPSEEVERIMVEIEEISTMLRAYDSRKLTAEAELEALQMRITELAELKKELEESEAAAAQEIAALQSEEQRLAEENERTRKMIEASLSEIEQLSGVLTESTTAVEQLQSTKGGLQDAENMITWYEGQLTAINQQYNSLRQAYDALDVEYSKLYEKQQ